MNSALDISSTDEQGFDENLKQGFRLHEWLVKPLENRIIGDEGELHLEPKLMDCLLCLASARGEVVTRQQLLNTVWSRIVVNEETLTRTMSELRKLLGDVKAPRRYIKTVPKRGYAIIPEVEQLGLTDIGRIEQPEIATVPSIAVLPFQNRSPDPENEFFTDGLTEEMICTLAQIKGLHVAASNSVFSFKDKQISIKDVSTSLGVTHVLEGSVRRYDNRIRITCQLVRAEDGFNLWAESYDRVIEDVFAIQEEIANAVISALMLRLGIGSISLSTTPTDDLRAYEQYLHARLKYQNEQPGMEYRGLQEAQRAVTLAPDCAEAHGLLSMIRVMNTISEPYSKNRAAIREHYEAALSQNPFQEEALMAKAVATRWDSWDWAAVRAMFEKALASSPNCPHVLVQFAARFYRDLCEFSTADKLLQKAVRLDPINPAPITSLGFNQRYSGEYDAALASFDRALTINPTHGYALLGKSLTLTTMERYSEAETLVNWIEKHSPENDLLALNCRGRLLACQGDRQSTQRVMNLLKQLSTEPGGEKHLALLGWMELLSGNIEEGINWLSLVLDKQISQVLNTRAFSQIPPLNCLDHPLVQGFLARMNMDNASVEQLRDDGILAPIDL